jgi:hypothetical protein
MPQLLLFYESPHPVFARVVLAKNPTGLLGKTFVTGDRRLVAILWRFGPIDSRVLFSRCAHPLTVSLRSLT